jgi:PAS domain S-box-containing protein
MIDLPEQVTDRESAERAVRRSALLQAVAVTIGSALTRDEVATQLVRHAVDAIGADAALVVVCSDDGTALELLSWAGYDPALLAHWRRFPLDAPMPICDAVKSAQPVWLSTPDEMAATYAVFRGATSPRVHQAIGAIPLLTEGRSIGAVGLAFREAQRWDDQDQGLVFAIAQLCAQALERARLFEAERRARIEAEREIARRVQAEAALRQSEEQLRLLTDALPVLIAYVDRDQRYQFNNKLYEQWFGWSREESRGVHMRDVLGPEIYAAVQPYVERALRGEQFSYEAMLPSRSGSLWPVRGTYVPHLSPSGEVLGYISLIGDNSERKRVEDRQQFLTEATTLLASSLDYEKTLAHVGQLMVPRWADWCSINLIDENGTFTRVAGVHVDARKQRMLDELRQRQPPSLEGQEDPARTLKIGKPLLVRSIDDATMRAMSSTDDQYAVYRAVGMRSAMILPLRSSNRLLGSLILTITESDRRYDEDDFELMQNVADRVAVAIENARLFRQVQDTVRIRDEFLSIAAHELKTPITALSGYAQLLQGRLHQDYVVGERDLRAVNVINVQVERLHELIDEMLDVARIERGHFTLDQHRLDLSALVEATADEFRQTLSHHTVEANLETPLLILGDEQRLQQVILNLLQNAVKYSPGGGAISVTTRRDGTDALLVVADTGMGIPLEAQASLFQRFYRAPNVIQSSISGVGLGLYIIHEIVTRHGGTVEVRSAENQGSIFTVRLPMTTDY